MVNRVDISGVPKIIYPDKKYFTNVSINPETVPGGKRFVFRWEGGSPGPPTPTTQWLGFSF
jgi:hypothetical protein